MHEVVSSLPQEQALLRLLQLPAHDFADQLAVPAEYALEVLGATTVTLLRLERGEGRVRSVVTVGDLPPDQRRIAQGRVLELSRYGTVLDLTSTDPLLLHRTDADLPDLVRNLLEQRGLHAAVAAPVHVGGRPWGVLWATRRKGPLEAGAGAEARRCAAAVAPMIALAERLRAMSALAFEDPLTGLGNRRRLDDALSAVLHEAGAGCTVVVCDVNGLKAVNDEHGHAAGDAVIVAVADALSSSVRELTGAVAVRTGGDEFTLVLPGQSRSAAIRAVEAAAATLSHHAIAISCGVATVPAGSAARTVLALADSAQYAAKGRGALVVALSDTESAADPRPRRHVPRGADRRARSATRDSQVAAAVQSLAGGLASMPESPRARMGWLAEQLLEPFDLDHWSLSRVHLTSPAADDAGGGGDGGTLAVESLGVRANRSPGRLPGDLMTDHVFALEDYPLTGLAVRGCGWFAVDVDDEHADADEVVLLRQMEQRWVVAVGWSHGEDGCLLELYGSAPETDVQLLGAAVGVMVSAVLGRAVSPVDPRRARMGA